MRKVSSTFSMDRIRAEKFRDFFILRENGYSIYHRAYVTSKVDDDLISGFLSAIFAFSRELSIDQIHVMDMQESKFIYETRSPFIFILNAAKDVDLHFGQTILIKIINFFEETIKTKLSSRDKSNDNFIIRELKAFNFDKKLDSFVNNALLEHYFASPTKILEEIESFLVGLFGSVGEEIINLSVQKVCKRKEFRKEHIEGLISAIGESLSKKMRGTQVEMITKQLKDAFVTNLK